MSKKATYFTDQGEKQLVVIKENADGTFDLGTDVDHVVVTSCAVTETGEVGSCHVEGATPKAKHKK